MKTADPAINTVIDNIGIMVASEGGSLELLELTDDYMKSQIHRRHKRRLPRMRPDDRRRLSIHASILRLPRAPHRPRLKWLTDITSEKMYQITFS